ncbi:hypothetical protein ASG67_17805 [Sphingomonas sp. Leaf339]|uniref:DUF3489 domain-containing protein n=1 Tax=Sphingomonas sp. Leaf339 TaxID=1736343 RepID=UPI0006FC927C|nr:DUF3489 domain-containing protein [Sphingomonas sp. Leaf339]KQU55185.1 hypothetical protein ASG67_17805 [Sphingomonas sp. Leaf339]
MPKLSDTQLILLASAAQRDGGSVLPLPDTLAAKAASTEKSIAALVKQGFAEERETSDHTAVSRVDGDLRYGVFVTAPGLAAIGIEAEVPDNAEGGTDAGGGYAATPVVAANPAARATKSASVVALLERNGGATLPELISATGWLPHTTRAALTGLRKKGHRIVRGTRGGATCYTIGAAA